MTSTRLFAALTLLFLLFAGHVSLGQEKIITGKITDAKDGTPVSGASVLPKGAGRGTSTLGDGTFRINVQESITTLIVSFIGFASKEVDINGKTSVNITLEANNSNLNEVVVVGYGTARKRDLTGAVASIRATDFNKGIQTAPDQLIQGKVAGVQVVNNSGAPGGATTIKIRGNASVRAGNQPLFVVDGIILDGRSARPRASTNTSEGGTNTGVGQTPDANPLNFINPSDIASMEVLKDASATAIYGSRGANGVVLITTKKGQSGLSKVDVNYSVATSSLLRRIDVLDAGEFKQLLGKYNFTNGDFGGDVDALDAILRTGISQNLSVSVSGGTETGKYRASFGYTDQQGIVKNSDFKRYAANVSGAFKFLESRKLGLDMNIMASQNKENIAPVSNDAGFTGSIIGQALQWNPTHPLMKPNDSIWVIDPNLGNTTINPLAMLNAYDDATRITTVIASVSPYYKFNNNLELRTLYSVNYGTGIRRMQIARWLNQEQVQGRGLALYGNNELLTQQFNATINYNKAVSAKLNLNALLGYEYMKFDSRAISVSAKDFGTYPLNYTDYLQYSSQSNRSIYSFTDPSSEIQSFFGRAVLNYDDKYLLTATFRADGSSKFGENNKYGYFPSFAVAWNISNEDFFSKTGFVNTLKLRASWGQTGNQEFPAGAAVGRYSSNGPGSFVRLNYGNADLKWQTDAQTDIGADLAFWNSRVSVTVDYFHRATKDLLFNAYAPVPGPTENPSAWSNLPGEVINRGLEAAINVSIIRHKELTWDFGINATFLKNEVSGLPSSIITGGLHGQGMSGTQVQQIANGQPLNVFYTREYQGIDKDGFSIYRDGGNTFYFVGNPNPTTLLGMNTRVNYKKIGLEVSMNGAYGQKVYNNTANSVLPVSNLPSRNTTKDKLNAAVLESLANPITASSRFIEKGNYIRLANATLSYSVGNLAKAFRNVNVYLTGQNLFIITKFTGFDPEVNTDKQVNGIPSVGIEYTPYPSARTFMLGVNFSL